MSFTLHWLSLYHFPLFLGFSPLEMKSFHTEYNPSAVEAAGNNFDDDGREKRTGTVMTASAHIITAVIGSGVLSLAWAIAQLGWVAGTVILVTFAVINYFTSTMLADCYRSPDTGIRNYNYMDVVRAYLGGWKVKLCGLAQYGSLVGITIGYTITASISLVAIGKANCFHEKGHGAKCSVSNYPLMAAFGIIQIVLSQIHNFHKLSFLSIIATVMSFSYASIGIGLALAALASGKVGKTDLTGTVVGVDVTASDKIWRSFQAAGDIAFSYAFSVVLVEIQACILSIRDDTLRSSPPENKVMKKASLAGVSTTTGFYILCGCIGYAAFGNQAPGDFLTDFGFYEPYWLIDFANACIAVHLIAAYQAFRYEFTSRYLVSPLNMKSFDTSSAVESGTVAGNNVDDDGGEKRTGTLMTASAHIITAVIGSGVLSLAWAIAQLGWVAGTVLLVSFAVVVNYTSRMLADCYRSPDAGTRNNTYMDVVRAYLGGRKVQLCGLAQYGSLVGMTIGYTITASISFVAIGKANCFHDKGHGAKFSVSNYPAMAAFGIIQIVLSQIPNFHKLSFLSIIAAVMSFSYSSIGTGLALADLASGKVGKTELTGTVVGVDVTASDKLWKSFQAAGNIAFSYAYSVVLVEIQACIFSTRNVGGHTRNSDTLSSSPPENIVMKKASIVGVSTATAFYILCACMGYATFGSQAPGDLLTDFGFYEPYWLIDFANACIAVHLIGAYQVKSYSLKYLSPLKMKSFDTSSVVESGAGAGNNVDDDCREKRTGTLITASAHIITTVIGSGVLSLAWAIAQLGWVVGTVILVAFAVIVNYTSRMLADSYRSPEGTRNYTYMDVVRVYLGGRKVQLCGLAQFGSLVGVTIGYTITASISLVAIGKANCFHDKGHGAKCSVSNYPLMAAFGIVQIFLSQIPNFHKLSFLSIIATVMSFSYASIGFGLALAALASGKVGKTGLTGTVVGVDVTASDKLWKSFQAAGNIAFSYAYSVVLVEIQACILSINDDTLRSSPPENKVMKKASLAAVSTTTAFYILCGCIGYATFGNQAPGDFLTDFGFYEPYWLIDFANACIAVHLIGAYQQVFAQPIFQFVEKKCNQAWPESNFITKEHSMNVPLLGKCRINFFRLVWRTTYVIFSTVVAMIFPFFNAILGLIGAVAFWPLTVYFPVEMHISQKKVKKYSVRWIVLKLLVFVCLIVSLLAAIGSIVGLISSVKAYKPFHNLD
ncbi:unnamed protein product [Brassica napus]|nr:unnamed protein product [Brassica napus]